MPRRKTVDENPGAVTSGSNSLDSRSKRKRAKADSGELYGKPRRSKSSGKLALLLEMPIEIFTEIACYMTPLDLLNLARTSIGLRELLMSKSSKRIWEAVRLIHNIPECPEDLSEPRYADLLYGKGCSFCPDTRAKKLYITLRIRACKTCFEEQTIDHYELYGEEGYKYPITNFLDHTMMTWTKSTYKSHPSKRYLVSQFREVLKRVKDLTSKPVELRDYISERHELTNSVIESIVPIEDWLSKVSLQKAKSNSKSMTERHSSIIKRLRDLGYDDDDFNDRYDEEEWKWGQLLNQSRLLTERVWQNVRPQLEKTIKLRRTHVGQRIYNDRHTERVAEMRRRFDSEETRHLLRGIPKGRLLSTGDFLELPIVVEMIEEDGCRLPLTDDRWQRVVEEIPIEVETLARTIEMDCVIEFKDSLLQCARDDLRMLFDADWDQEPGIEGVRDEIPKCLNSALALFNKGSSSLVNFADILYTRSFLQHQSVYEKLLPWKEEKFETTPSIITTALLLLEHLDLPKETSMAFMMACGHDFECLRCDRDSSRETLSWLELVYHFILKTQNFEMLQCDVKKRDINVPLRDAHSLSSLTRVKVVSRTFKRITVDMSPTGGNPERYSTLATSWGQRLLGSALGSLLLVVGKQIRLVPVKRWKIRPCHLCQSLNVIYHGQTQTGMYRHMKTSHGTDMEGNVLPDYASSSDELE
ncbi:hypothetical protein SCHPADRAFT_925128 [Schizopora paradoxa]|uniref:F-box domain-containing protein n=1 Tax=Schizopora paradoxa TaxID=27342 RepID=A0A0H2S3G1_9AGAM|nr:hypothetical protein SCHPADRAFT_925128 [Schizopora paradoxa]